MQLYCNVIYYRLFTLLKLHVSKCFFFLEVRLGCGSSTKIKSVHIQRILCATVVTFKKKNRQRENQFRAICTCR